MPQMSVRRVLAASGTDAPFQGSEYEFLSAVDFPRGAACRIGMLTDATGVLRTIKVGGQSIEEESPVQLGTINTQPIFPDHFTVGFLVGPGQRLQVTTRDTSGAQRIVMCIIIIDEL